MHENQVHLDAKRSSGIIGACRKDIKELKLPSDHYIRDEERFRKLFKKDDGKSLLKSLDKRNCQKFLVCLPGKISPDGKEFLREDDAVEGIPGECAEMIQRESRCPEVKLMNDAEAWGLGYLHYLHDQKIKIKLPAVLFTFGTGVGSCLLYEEGEFTIAKGYELNEHPDEFRETAKAAGKDRVYQEQIHEIIGQDFFTWAKKHRPEWDDEKTKTEFTERVVAFVNDLRESDTFRNELSGKKICTLFFGGGNAHRIDGEEVKKKVEGVKEITAPRTPTPSEIESIRKKYKYHQCLTVFNGGEVNPLDPRFIPLLGFKGKIKTVYIKELDDEETDTEEEEEEETKGPDDQDTGEDENDETEDPEENICIIDPTEIDNNSGIKANIEKQYQGLGSPLKFLNPENWTAEKFEAVIDDLPSHSKTSVYLVIDARRTWPDGQRIEKLKDLKDKMKQVILVLVRNPETEKTTKLDSWKSEADKLEVKCDEVEVTE